LSVQTSLFTWLILLYIRGHHNPSDFKGPVPYYYSNSVVELRENEKDVAAPLNLWLGTADKKQKAFTVAREVYLLLTVLGAQTESI